MHLYMGIFEARKEGGETSILKYGRIEILSRRIKGLELSRIEGDYLNSTELTES